MDTESWLRRRVGRTRYWWQAGLKSNTRWGVINVLQRVVLWGRELSCVYHKNYEFWATVWTWRRRLLFIVSYRLSKGKVKVIPLQARCDPELYSSMTAALEGGELSAAPPGRTLPQQRNGTYRTGGLVCPRAGLDGRKISSPPGFDPGSSST